MAKGKVKTTEDKSRDQIVALARKIWRATDKLQFSKASELVTQLQKTLQEGSKLPNANPDPEDYHGYPPDRNSGYLTGHRTQDVITRIETVVPSYSCECPPDTCPCDPTEESPISVNGVSCYFCNETLARFTNAYWLKIQGAEGSTICRLCRNILMEKLYPKWSAGQDISDLVTDALEEHAFLQFAKALEFAEEAQRRADIAAQTWG